jgi:hypothetical protein
LKDEKKLKASELGWYKERMEILAKYKNSKYINRKKQ